MNKSETRRFPPGLTRPPLWRRVFPGLLLLVGFGILLPFDVLIEANAQIDDWPGDLKRVFQLLELFGHGTGLVLVAVGLVVLRPDLKRLALRMLGGWLLAGALVNLVKLVVHRIRPAYFHGRMDGEVDGMETWLGFGRLPEAWVAENEQWKYLSDSFPSGHSANAVVLALCMSWIFPRGRCFFAVLAVLACLQRVVAWAHWPSDLLAGAFCGWIAAHIAWTGVRRENLLQ